MTKDEALAKVREAAALVAMAQRNSTLTGNRDEWIKKTRALTLAEMDAIMAGATATEVEQAAN